MSNGLIKFFVIVVSLACLYSISFTFVTRKVEKDAAAYAQGDLAKEQAYLDSIAGEVVYNLGIATFTYREAKTNEIALGLDLKGGMNVTMEISLDELIANLADTPKDANFNKALESAVTKSRTSGTSLIDLFLSEYRALGAGTPIANFFATTDNAGQISRNSSE